MLIEDIEVKIVNKDINDRNEEEKETIEAIETKKEQEIKIKNLLVQTIKAYNIIGKFLLESTFA